MKMILKLTAAAVLVMSVAGCATDDYKIYAAGQSQIESAKYMAEAERYKAMAAIASSGPESAKVAAVVAMAMQNSNSGAGNGSKMQAPQSNEALQWASLLVPSITQLAGISANVRLGLAQSDNAARVAVSTNEAFVGIAGKIQAPAANVTTTTTTSSADVATTFSGTGVLGSGSFATTANPTTTTTTTSNANPTTTTNANPTTTTTTGATTTVTCTGNTVTTGNNGCPQP